MNTAEPFVEQMRAFTRRQLAVFCMSCADRMSPAFVAFAQHTPASTYVKWMAQAWQVVGARDKVTARSLAVEMSAAPEADETDSYLPDYWAMRALNPLRYAVEAVFENALERAQWSSISARELLASFAYDVPNNLPEHQRLDRSVGDAQRLELHADRTDAAGRPLEPAPVRRAR